MFRIQGVPGKYSVLNGLPFIGGYRPESAKDSDGDVVNLDILNQHSELLTPEMVRQACHEIGVNPDTKLPLREITSRGNHVFFSIDKRYCVYV